MTTTEAGVVVVGGGIGGLANAYALASAGHRVQVLERASDFTEVGAGLQMAPNATRILAGWGLLDEVIEVGVRPRRLVFRDALDGRELTHLDLGDGFVERYGAPYVVVHRTDLLQILVDACRRAGVELLVDSEVDGVELEPDGAVVSVGQRRIRGDVVLAADGLRSTLRDRFDPEPPIASGYVAYRGAFPVADLPGGHGGRPLDEVVVYFGPGCHLVQYALRRGEILNTVAVFKSPGYDRGDEDWGGAEELDEVFAACCDAVHQGLETLWRDRRWPMYDRLPIPRWVDGRLALTGDAAHPMLQYLAQGACQALEDADSLATIAGGSSPGTIDWPTTLAAFEERRTARTARVQLAARTWGEMWHVDGVARLLRNELFSTRAADDFTHIDWLYGADPV